MTIPVLAIDGPSGAGKGSVSRAVAKKLGWHYLDSGAIYRSLAIDVLDQSINMMDEVAIVRVAQNMQLVFDCQEQLIVKLNNIDITIRLPTEEIGAIASKIAAYPAVRQALLQKQKDFRRLPGLVADGRDMGTVVFTDAHKKVFLTASATERGVRRFKQLKEKGIDANLDEITKEIQLRDRRDSERTVAPLIPAEDAFYLDSSDLTLDDVIKQVITLAVK